ncbi:hypothetical protein NUW58_g2703 [Xylaria curta]|uniref:Uncharacterized protein n=1 Tax=Xylaria curta TaxID=42375 RepID=A0ACC1PEB7_9PEZI|nr:hypothetical protein NUW58_g2703 [Xylaria curta]
MGIAYRTLKEDEIRLLAISPQDSHAGDDRVHCIIKYVSLSKSELKRGSESQSGRINFRGEVKDECPEYLTVMTEIDGGRHEHHADARTHSERPFLLPSLS